MVRPFQEVETFDWNVSNKIHKNLVTRLHSSKDKTGFQARLPMSKSTKLIRTLPTNDIIVAAMNAKTDSSSRVTTIPAIPHEAHNDVMIVSSTREKQRILEAYETKFGMGYPDSMIMRKKGKLIDTTLLLPHSRTQRMRPSKDVGTLQDGYVHNVPLPRVPREQRISPELTAPKAGIPLPGYSRLPAWIPTLPKIGNVFGFSQRLL